MSNSKLVLDRVDDLLIVRDDLLAGGTKERACRQFLEELAGREDREFVYASPFCGFAQVALARACADLGQRCTLFVARDPHYEEKRPHEYSLLAASFGAELVVCETLHEAHAKTLEYANESGALVVPLGFDHPGFRRILTSELNAVWAQILETTTLPPARLWLPVGSGTLAKCLRAVVPTSVELRLINVNVLKVEDTRLMEVMKLPNVRFENAPELFDEPSSVMPPIPSNLHYDAKLWRFLKKEGRAGDLWWNVAR